MPDIRRAGEVVKIMSGPGQFRIEPATTDDTPLVLKFIKGLAEYEGLEHEVVATEEGLRWAMFGP